MNNPFIVSHHQISKTSLNDAILVDLPGVGLPASLKGGRVGDLVSAEAAINMIDEHRDIIKIPADVPKEKLTFELIRISKEKGSYAKQAVKVANEYAMRVVYLLMLLVRGDQCNREVRKDWDDTHWDYWKSVRSIYMAGGLSSGIFGELIKANFEKYIGPPRALYLIGNRGYMSLLGAARTSYNIPDGKVLGFDFGGTNIKRGIIDVHNGRMVKLTILPPLKVERDESVFSEKNDKTRAYVRKLFYGTIQDSLFEYKNVLKDQWGISISIANYIANDDVIERTYYGNLAEYDEGLNLKGRIIKRIGIKGLREENIRIFHDGSSAAACINDSKPYVVLALGTAIAAGFPVDVPCLDLDLDTLETVEA
jgi:hypothetical protein